MPAQDSQGRYITPAETLTDAAVASAARTATANGSSFDTSNLDSLTGTITVTAASGTDETLDVELQTSADGSNFYKVDQFTQKTGTATADARVFGPLGATSRWRWVIGGTDTPSFTFSISATADRDS